MQETKAQLVIQVRRLEKLETTSTRQGGGVC